MVDRRQTAELLKYSGISQVFGEVWMPNDQLCASAMNRAFSTLYLPTCVEKSHEFEGRLRSKIWFQQGNIGSAAGVSQTHKP